MKLHEQHSQLTAPSGDAASTPHDSTHVEPASTIDRGPDLLVCATQQSKSAHPGDLRRALGTKPQA